MEQGTNKYYENIEEVSRLCRELGLNKDEYVTLDPDKLYRNLHTLRIKEKWSDPQDDLGD